MLNKFRLLILYWFLLLMLYNAIQAQGPPIQYPAVLKNSFIGVSIGYINYPFSNFQLEAGFHAASVHVPHTAVRINLFGHEFNKYLAAQIIYMRPVKWVKYENVNQDGEEHSVWMNVAGFSIKAQTPSWKNFSVYGEGGFCLVTRHGFKINNEPVVKNADYGSVLMGAGLQYRLNNKWLLQLSTIYSPKNSETKQPHTIFYSAAFTYTMRELSKEVVRRNEEAGFSFSKDLLQLGYTTNGLGYGVNDFVSNKALPIFWAGEVQVRRGISLTYQHNIFHSKKVFSWDWGANISYWQSRIDKNDFFTISLFPLMRFTAFRWKMADIYFDYSVAGPTYISQAITDGLQTGAHFTFQDFMGMGAFMGTHQKINAEIRIMHYSNGNIFPENSGYMIPLTFNLGYSF